MQNKTSIDDEGMNECEQLADYKHLGIPADCCGRHASAFPLGCQKDDEAIRGYQRTFRDK
ncbi:hypothetical protein [Cytobacillus gottheilii]|uniref:hypothetical protein n=1 Tax=Cytobacillus gottheilii TaxID=859144 RepID=UPI001FE904E1|nr:hypothetical protein [Cytobacillus gottheilii]